MHTASRSHIKSWEWEYLRNVANNLISRRGRAHQVYKAGTCRLSTVRPIKYLNCRFSKSLLRYGVMCCTRPRLKKVAYIVCILGTVNTTKHCSCGEANSTYACVRMPTHPLKTVTSDKGETRIPVRQDARRMTASSIQQININLVMSPRGAHYQIWFDWLTVSCKETCSLCSLDTERSRIYFGAVTPFGSAEVSTNFISHIAYLYRTGNCTFSSNSGVVSLLFFKKSR